MFRKAVELFEHQQSSGASKDNANVMEAMAWAYRALNRPDHALRLLRSARRLAASSNSPTFFSASAYTWLPKRAFIDEIDARI